VLGGQVENLSAYFDTGNLTILTVVVSSVVNPIRIRNVTNFFIEFGTGSNDYF
jgi:hypothetical protein